MNIARLLSPILVAASLLAPMPAAFAAPADVALLQKYAGEWRGQSTLKGAESGNVSCRLELTPNGDKIIFNGRCSIDGGVASGFRGTLAYNEEAKRFEARSSDGGVVGRKSGGGVIFDMSGTNERGTVASTMALVGDRIKFDIKLTDATTNGVTTSSITFARA
jgi:hypothetical protein